MKFSSIAPLLFGAMGAFDTNTSVKAEDTSAAIGSTFGRHFTPLSGESIPPYVYGSVAKPSQRQRRKAWRRTQRFPTR